MNLELLPSDLSDEELDGMLADLDRALDGEFLQEVDRNLERMANSGELGGNRAPGLAAG